ncbi:MAG: hypothetical protein AB1779_06630 [Candidatus Thermoplasmatota archaeon]
MKKLLCALMLSIFLVSVIGSANAILVVQRDEDKSPDGKYGVSITVYGFLDAQVKKWNKFAIYVKNEGTVKEKIVLKIKGYGAACKAKLTKKTVVLKPGQEKVVYLKVKPNWFVIPLGGESGEFHVYVKAYVKGKSNVCASLDLEFTAWYDLPIRPMTA